MARSSGRTSNGGIEVRSIFPTPIVVARPPVTEAENRRLAGTILAREGAAAGVVHSNMMGWQSDDTFAQWGGQDGAKVLAFARTLADKLTGDRAGNRVEVDWFVNAWANVNRKGHANQAHAHPGALWSGSYYVDDGGAGADPAVGGAFEIMDPRGLAPAMYAPELAPNLTGCHSTGGSELIRPETGMMLLFPAWLSHGVRPYLGAGTRISVAFNFALPAAQA